MSEVYHLKAIPGISTTGAITLLSQIGTTTGKILGKGYKLTYGVLNDRRENLLVISRQHDVQF